MTEENESLRFWAGTVLVCAVILMLPAVWSFGSAVVSAFQTGEVLVISVGRTETVRHMVPWTHGWARFVGPVVMAFSLALYPLHRGRPGWWWLAAFLALVGVCLLLFSAWFVSLRSTAAFLLLGVFIGTSFWIDARLGRKSAFFFMLACALGLAIFSVGG